jgi:hypothetical protein
MEKVLDSEHKRFKNQFNIEIEDEYPSRGVFKVISLFKAIEDALRNAQSQARVASQVQREDQRHSNHQDKFSSKENDSRLGNQSQLVSNLNISLE